MSNKRLGILALHGFTGSGEDFKEFSPFCQTPATWHCPDLPGHGAAPQLDCTPTSTIDFVEKERAKLVEELPKFCVLIGYSMGARAALLHATQSPNSWDAVILISGNPGIESDTERESRRISDELRAKEIERDGVQDFLKKWQATPMIRSQSRISEPIRGRMQRNRLRNTALGLSTSLREFGQGRIPSLWREMKRIHKPILFLSGSEDRKYSLIAARTGFQHVSISGAGHMPQLEAPELTARAVDTFLGDLSKKDDSY